MKNICKRSFVAATIATLIGAGSAAAQVQTKTVQMGSNCTVTVTTSVLTNGGALAPGATSASLDPQIIVQALGGQDGGGVTVSGGAIDPKAILQIISSAMAGKSGGAVLDPQVLVQSFAGPLGGAGGGVVTTSALLETNPVTWLGLAADEVSADVRAQLPLPEGAGLIVRHVTPGSPAAQAGVQANDLLIKLDDQLLINPAQLRALIRGKAEGEKITLSLLRKGKELKVAATLVKKAPPAEEAGLSQTISLGSFGPALNTALGQMGGQGGPVVFHKAFTTGNGTNLAATINIQAILETVSNAMQKAQQELNGPNR